jgi:hypothetical protein
MGFYNLKKNLITIYHAVNMPFEKVITLSFPGDKLSLDHDEIFQLALNEKCV